ncbi:secretoglobin family 1C member 1 precursor isoform C [Alligator mississippiensis]|uniref:Secretoglobin family 1C member 1 isoform C n=1 Tax=Alligator mississippiensis TaxID=8496 RepID=A0A151NXN2_ALLMI|nr:secretoglobin family 1C member 1 precursor isoform C [Alligator mississippiensis]
MKLTAVVLLVTLAFCCFFGTVSAREILPGFLNTLLEGTLEQLYVGPISQYRIDDVTKAALAALKKCIESLSQEHTKALVKLLKMIRSEA